MSVQELVKQLNDTIETHIDIIWQEEWFDFYDQAAQLYEQVKGENSAVDETAEKMMSVLDEGGDAPSQEEWYDICDSVCAMSVELYNAGIIGSKILDAYPDLYQYA